MTDVEKKRKSIINVIYYVMIAALFFLIVRYAMGVCFPIVCAFFIATILQKPKKFLTKKTFLKSGSASVVSLFLLIFVVLSLFVLIGVRAVQEISGFIDYITLQLQNIDVVVTNIETAVMNFIGRFLLRFFLPDDPYYTIYTTGKSLYELYRVFYPQMDRAVFLKYMSDFGLDEKKPIAKRPPTARCRS